MKSTRARLLRWKDALLDVPIIVKIMGIGLAISMLLSLGIYWRVYTHWKRNELGELEEAGLSIAKYIGARAAPLLNLREVGQLQPLLTETSQALPRVYSVRLLDKEGHTVAETTSPNPHAELLEVTVPLPAQQGGSVRVSMDRSQVARHLASLTRRIAATIAVISTLALTGTWWAARLFTEPMGELVQNLRAVKAGDLSVRTPVRSHDEVGELAATFNEMAAALQQKNEACEQLLRKLFGAEDDERKRIARELHDCTGQALTSLIAGLTVLQSGGRSQEQLSGLLSLAAQALHEVNDLSRALHPSSIDELGLAVALPKYCEGCSKRLSTKVACETIGLQHSRLPRSMEAALYRIGQEAVTNAVRHGHASKVDLLVHRKAGSVTAVIEDDGQGFDASDWRRQCLRGHHLGLLSMEERAKLLGGTFRVESRPGAGTSLYVELPLSDEPSGTKS